MIDLESIDVSHVGSSPTIRTIKRILVMNRNILNDIYFLVERSEIPDYKKEIMKQELLSIILSDSLSPNIPIPPEPANINEHGCDGFGGRIPQSPESPKKLEVQYSYEDFNRHTSDKETLINDPVQNQIDEYERRTIHQKPKPPKSISRYEIQEPTSILKEGFDLYGEKIPPPPSPPEGPKPQYITPIFEKSSKIGYVVSIVVFLGMLSIIGDSMYKAYIYHSAKEEIKKQN